MACKSGSCWAVPLFLSAFLAAGAARAEDVILLDDTAPQPTATFTPVPVQKALPTPTPVPPQTNILTPVPAGPAPSSEEPSAVDENPSESAKLAQRLGLLKHPIVTLALDGDYSYAFSTADPSLASGFGLDGRVEIQFFTWLSTGAYYDLTLFPATQRIVWTGPLGLMARVLPWGEDKTSELNPFLIGGAGLNSLMGLNSPQYPGNFQAFAGVGARNPFGDKWAVEFAVTYKIYSADSPALQAVSARLGLDYSFEP